MQRTLTALLLFLFTLPAWAQTPIPGTFTRMQPRRNTGYSSLYYTPVITTPQMTFDSALPMVAGGETMVMSAPFHDEESGVASEEAAYPSEPNERAYPGRMRFRSMRLAPFDFVVAPTDGVNPGESEDNGSLGETAAAIRKGPPPTQRNFTNDDINRMNESSGGNLSLPNAKPQEEHSQPNPNVKPQNNQLQEKHSPFAPQLTAEE